MTPPEADRRQDPRVGRFLLSHMALFFMPSCLCDAHRIILYWSRHAERVTGISAAETLGRAAHARLLTLSSSAALQEPSVAKPLPSARPSPLDLFLAERRQELAMRYGSEHLVWDTEGNLAILDCAAGEGRQRLVLCGRWRDETTGEDFSYLAWAWLKDYAFPLSPSVDLHQLLRALDRKGGVWFGANQDELTFYLSQGMIDALYAADTSLEDIVGCSICLSMPSGAAQDHARTIAALTPEESARTVLHWPHQDAAGCRKWTQSYPNIVPVNGRQANFSLVVDITAQKERDTALNNILSAHRKGRQTPFSQDLLTMFAGRSARMGQTLETLLRAALSLVTVAIYGETGTGKSLAARLVHQLGSRSEGPFVAVNCGAIPEELFESAFFGHIRGSFTGAVTDKEGLLTRADTGTLFLDEIAELSLRSQAKLLQALSEKNYTPVGSTESLSSKFRLIVATNRDLEECVRRGTFREDLFYRVNVLDVRLPPLRERREDIPLLLDHILERNGIALTPPAEALRLFQIHSWPGNIRELENVALRYAAERNMDFFHPMPDRSAPGPIPAKPPTGSTLRERLFPHERDILLETLARHRWNRDQTARELGLSRVTLYRKMRDLDLL